MSARSWAMVSRAVAPSRVAVRDPSGSDLELVNLCLGTKTHEATLCGILMAVTIKFDTGATRSVPPAWVRPAIDFTALLHLPRL